MYAGVTYVPCVWLSMEPLLSPCFCNLNVSRSLTPRVLLEYVSCRATAHLPWHLFHTSFLLWPCCSGLPPHYLMSGLSWCVFPGVPITPTLAMTSRLTLPRAYLFPHSPLRTFQGWLPWRGSAGRWSLRCPLQLSPCSSHWLHPGPGEPHAGSWVGPAAVSCLLAIKILFLINLENIFQN